MTTKIFLNEHAEIIRLYKSGLSADKIAAQYEVTNGTIYHILQKHHIIRRYRYVVDESFFDKINSEQKAYWLGFLYADGWIYRHGYTTQMGIEVNIQDILHLEKLRVALHSSHPLSYRTTCPMVRLTISNPKLVSGLIQHGMIQRKSLILSFPNWLASDLIRHFIRGYVDGDGSLHIASAPAWNGCQQPQLNIASSTKFLLGVRDYLHTIEGVGYPNPYHQKGQKDIWAILAYGGGGQVPIILRHLYDGATIYLDRKYAKAQSIIQQFSHKKKPQI